MSRYLERSKQLRADTARHYNCAQGVFVPFAETFGLTEEQAFGTALHFGRGMKMGSVCGAVTGALMVLGMAGADDEAVTSFLREIRSRHDGMLDCKDLLRVNAETDIPKKQHCDDMVFECLELTEQILKERGIIGE